MLRLREVKGVKIRVTIKSRATRSKSAPKDLDPSSQTPRTPCGCLFEKWMAVDGPINLHENS